MEFLPNQIWAISLVFARVGAILMLAPGIGDSSIPPRFRLLLALFIAMLIAPLVEYLLPALPSDISDFYRYIGVEILTGLNNWPFIKNIILCPNNCWGDMRYAIRAWVCNDDGSITK